MQQYLPFTVLKPGNLLPAPLIRLISVATVLTVYGIETHRYRYRQKYTLQVATVLTVYGIETCEMSSDILILHLLQQYLPFTVLKPKRFVK